MRLHLLVTLILCWAIPTLAETPRVFEAGQTSSDSRLNELRTLNSEFPFKVFDDPAEWQKRKNEVQRRILISQGLWPTPTKTDIHAVVHGRQDFDDYTVEAVYFQSIPGHYVTGSLYRPKGKTGPFPAVLCPHGHWSDARFYDAGEAAAKLSIANGAERFISAARNHIQARCVQLARMGCVAFLYDTTGNSDSIQMKHRPDIRDSLDAKEDWLFFSVQADLRLQNMMGLQTWNSVRSIDYLTQLLEVVTNRIGATGASGGGTQSMIIAAIDERISAAMPCVMVSTAMQGGCTCENAPLLRIDQGNIDIAATIAPRPLGLTAADDWTTELETNGYPELRNLYAMLGHKNRLTAAFNTHFKHNYNHVNRTVMYGFFNQHFRLGLDEPILEQDFQLLTKEQFTVWSDNHPAPSDDQIDDAHEIELLRITTHDSDERIAALVPKGTERLTQYRHFIGGAWETILGRRLDQVGKLKFASTETSTTEGFEISLGRIDHVTASEQIPLAILRSETASDKGIVVWVGDDGKSSCMREGKVIEPVAALLHQGYTVVACNLLGQGEFVADGKAITAQRMWHQRKGLNAWENSAAYTFGYNHPLFVQRTHDLLSVIKYAKSITDGEAVHLVGRGNTAGPIALAARSQSADAVAKTIIDVDGFRFADVERHDSPMFVPGAVKYLDVAGLLSLCAPHPISVAGLDDLSIPKAVYATAGAPDALQAADRDSIPRILAQP